MAHNKPSHKDLHCLQIQLFFVSGSKRLKEHKVMTRFEEACNLKNTICIMMFYVYTFSYSERTKYTFSIYTLCPTVLSVCINEENLENVSRTSNDFLMNISQLEWSYNTNIA